MEVSVDKIIYNEDNLGEDNIWDLLRMMKALFVLIAIKK